MEIKQYQAAIEAIVFAGGEPVGAARLAQVLELNEETVIRIADDWLHAFNARGGGVMAVKLDDAYQLCTRKEYAAYVRTAMDIRRNVPLSQAAMEVLAIIAYNQPVTKAFVEQVRGVDCGAVLQGLLTKNLVEEKGRLELPGRPLLYGTTPTFLRSFSISALGQLPPLPHETDDTMQDTTLEEVIEEQEAQAHITDTAAENAVN